MASEVVGYEIRPGETPPEWCRGLDEMTDGRTCGDCRLCCKLVSVEALEKPAYKWCQHVCERGCGIQETKPAECAKFKCAWLEGAGRDEDRPDRSGLIAYCNEQTHEGLTMSAVVVYERRQGEHEKKKNRRIMSIFATAAMRMKMPMVVFYKRHGPRTMFRFDPLTKTMKRSVIQFAGDRSQPGA